jgi:uncharacterized protein YndB with AHSA1/START domain
MTDPSADLFGISRRVAVEPSDTGLQLRVVSRISSATSAAELWRSVTDPDRLRRWFLPVTGELRVGGAFQAVGNAAGTILRCDPAESPESPDAAWLLRLTWGDESSVVEVTLVPDAAGQTSLELAHSYPLSLAGNGTGAFYVGPGWDFALNALRAFHADTPLIGLGTAQEQVFNRQSLLAWALVVEASGTATPEEVAVGVTETLPQWAPDLA